MFEVEVGKNYFLMEHDPVDGRSHSWFWLGTVTAVRGDVVAMSPVAWVADTGRFSAFTRGELPRNAELEAVGAPGGMQFALSKFKAVMEYPYPLPFAAGDAPGGA
jgi:hypothetical protein